MGWIIAIVIAASATHGHGVLIFPMDAPGIVQFETEFECETERKREAAEMRVMHPHNVLPDVYTICEKAPNPT